jgi:hypothetical protein
LPEKTGKWVNKRLNVVKMLSRHYSRRENVPRNCFIKLSRVLGQTIDLAKVKEIMLTPINSEITPREPCNGYLICQGGLPEAEDFIRKYH